MKAFPRANVKEGGEELAHVDSQVVVSPASAPPPEAAVPKQFLAKSAYFVRWGYTDDAVVALH